MIKEKNYNLQIFKNDCWDSPDVYHYINLKAAKEAGKRLLANRDTNTTAFRILRIDSGHYKTMAYEELKQDAR